MLMLNNSRGCGKYGGQDIEVMDERGLEIGVLEAEDRVDTEVFPEPHGPAL